ncbi:Arv1 protein [Polychytrium aggregatum]|uniref:Arv1 protein n=1 Tax=Polychytrium aggregatum TaxID=110093 RepID=UPI0022FDFF06|nr:Arv1 protein [Polychytrium aggregatum]KAI9209577.1 Arv1 protein [Polychytrium aggregatum]
MPVCISCGSEVPSLYTIYGLKRDGKASAIKRTHCSLCGSFADRYIENELLIVLIDMILLKPEAYRHLLFNRIRYENQGWNTDLLKFGVVLILFEVYVKWYNLQHRLPLEYTAHELAREYAYMIFICASEILLFHCAVRSSVYLIYRCPTPTLNRINVGIVACSMGKLMLIPMAVWNYNSFYVSWTISLFVMLSQSEGLAVLLNEHKPRSVIPIVAAGMLCRIALQLLWIRWDPRMALLPL